MAAVIAVLVASSGALAGDFTPPVGPVGSTMKSLETIEPRIPIGPNTTPGDATGVFVISTPGSYYLTGDVVGQAGKHGIRIDASQVSLDLNGFTLRGVPASLAGIQCDLSAEHLCIANGIVSNWGTDGINAFFASQSNFRDLIVTDNTLTGMYVAEGSSVRCCRARQNGVHGFSANGAALFEGCHSMDNGELGFFVSRGTATNCSSIGNGDAGFALGATAVSGGTASHCLASLNPVGFRSFSALGPAVLDHCQADSNTTDGFDIYGGGVIDSCSAYRNGDDGFQLGGGVVAIGCQSRENGYGFFVPGSESFVRIDSCSATINTSIGFLISGNDSLVVRNVARGNINADYQFSAAAQYGALVAASGTITADPWANFGLTFAKRATNDPDLARKDADAAAQRTEIERRRAAEPVDAAGAVHPERPAR